MSNVDYLFTNAGAVRAQFQEVANLLPEEVSDTITPAVFMEFHRSAIHQTRRTINNRLHREEILKLIADSKVQLQESSDQLEALLLQPKQLHQTMERLKREQADLQAALAAKDKEIVVVKASIAAISTKVKRYARAQQEVEEHINRAQKAINQISDLGPNDYDLAF